MPILRSAAALAALLPLVLTAQSTNGLLAGRVLDASSGAALAGAGVQYRAAVTSASGRSVTALDGRFALAALSPDTYQLRISAPGFQSQEVSGLELAVAGRLEVDFRLRPLADVFGAREQAGISVPGGATLVRFFGPDVDMSRTQFLPALRTSQSLLEPSLSEVIHPREIRDLPLAGRDVYSLLVTQAGVTADSGTSRGLGLAASGQRPSSSNYLLDGVENNNNLITGPLTAITPEAVQEYRFTSSNFSAEFGGTSGFIANAATRAGGAKWHGTGYYYSKDTALNAATFQENRLGTGKAPTRERQPGFQLGGPLRRDRLFVSSALEVFRSRSLGDAIDILLPGPALLDFTAPNGPTRLLLQQFPSPIAGTAGTLTTHAQMRPPISVNRLVALERGDWLLRGGAHRLVSRLSLSRVDRPDFIWSPYPDFVSPLNQNSLNFMAGSSNLLRPNLSSEARIAYSRDRIAWSRAHPEIPTLSTGDGVALPGSQAFYEYRNRSSAAELRDTMTWIRGAHIVKFGASALLRSMSVLQSTGRDGLYLFDTVIDWALEEPGQFAAAVDRASKPSLRTPDPNRNFQRKQFAGFLQDTWRLAPRVAVNAGIRYESYGAPVSDGATRDFTLVPGPGADFSTRMAAAAFTAPSASGGQAIYPADRNDWAGRFGISWSPSSSAVVRGSYGIFYDRLFDNAWQNIRANSLELALFSLPSGSVNYLDPVSTELTRLQGTRYAAGFPSPVLMQPGLRTPYSQSYFAGVEQRLGTNWTVEVNGAGSLGRQLITTDVINRQTRLTTAPRMISYLGNQGRSDYHALTMVARFRPSWGLLHVAYTWSHSIDLQSEPLSGDFFDLSFTRAAAPARNTGISAFSRELDANGDRGNSNFDQRHNLVAYSVWDLPGHSRLLRNWKVAQMAAIRSGFPLTVFVPSTVGRDGQFLLNARADLIASPAAANATAAVPGGQQWLNAAAFRAPAAGTQGNTGRNAFRGPGLVNVDLSLTRSFPLPWFGEAGRLSLRMDAFNVLNHANLNSPGTTLGSDAFGIALRGRTGRDGGFPALTPFTETARQLQVLLRVEF